VAERATDGVALAEGALRLAVTRPHVRDAVSGDLTADRGQIPRRPWYVACCLERMTKPWFVSLAMTAACTGSDVPPAASSAEASSSGRPDTGQSVARVASRDGTPIAFEKIGHGEALVIVGGALSDRSGAKPLAAALGDHFTVYIYDRRGRGQSGDTKPYSVDREIEDLEAIIERSGDRARVYGVSSGAALALQAAVKLPSKVVKLAVYEPPYGQDPGAYDRQKVNVNRIVEAGQPGDAAEFFLAEIGTPPEAIDGMKHSPDWKRMAKIDFTLAYDYAVLGDGQVPDAVAQISAPTLVMDGEKSMPFIRPSADRLAELIPSSRRKTLAGQTHQAKPEAVAPVLIEFFSSSQPTASR
jgi:pimeloyl-ACP methyl ester carboxylesterase